ncbi:MAG: YraN family protein [Flavitalea sp.]
MGTHHETGRSGELLAITYLEARQFNILHTNWRYSYYEIDVIAVRDHILHFIEIKTRKGSRFGFPEESVSIKKMRNIMIAAASYQFEFPGYSRVQYDVLSISLQPNMEPEYFFIEDVYGP